jgi:hypothetical protein
VQLSPRFSIEDWNFGVCSGIDAAAGQLDGSILKPAADRNGGVPALLKIRVGRRPDLASFMAC